MTPKSAPDIALLLVRLTLAFVFIAHGSQKLFGAFGGGGIAGTADFFTFLGVVPGSFWAVIVALVEFAGGIALALGVLTRLAALAILVDMLAAVILYNAANGFFVETPTGGWEINLALGTLACVLILATAGKFSVDHWLRGKRPAGSHPLALSRGR